MLSVYAHRNDSQTQTAAIAAHNNPRIRLTVTKVVNAITSSVDAIATAMTDKNKCLFG